MESILLVDDNDVFRQRLEKGFSRRGYRVLGACCYEEAMEAIRDEHPAMAVVDLKMPGQNGLRLLADGLRLAPDLRVVVLTGYGSIATATEAIRLGALAYLAKPATIDEIVAAFGKDGQVDGTDEGDNISPPTLQRVEWEHIQRVLQACDGNISETARRLNIHRRTLQRKLNSYAPPENVD